MMQMDPSWIIHLALSRGAVSADAYVVEEVAHEAYVRLGELESLRTSRETRCSLRLFLRNGCAAGSTSDLSPRGVEELVENLLELARDASVDETGGPPSVDLLGGGLDDVTLWDPSVAGSAVDATEYARRAEAAALRADRRIVSSEGAEAFERDTRVAYAASVCPTRSFRASLLGVAVTVIAGQDDRMQQGHWYTTARWRRGLASPDDVGREAARRACRRLGATSVSNCEVPIVFDPETAATLVQALAQAVSGQMVCRGTSWLAGRLGERVAASAVTIIDDPVLPKALGSRPFDGEGVPARPMAVVADGVLDRYLLDVRSARALGLPPTGRAVREREGAVTAGPTNLYVKPGPSSPKEIIGSVDQGLYLTELSGPGVNIATGDYSRAASGFWIEQGRLAFPVHEITIAGNLLDLWGRVEMVGADLVFRRPIAAPTLKIGRMVVAGAPSKSLFD